ncbi:MAG: hypothetical protein RJA25_485 [Bacteroidota bacterium]|jgi:hypothetical protein
MKKISLIIILLISSISFAKKWDAVYINKLIASGGIDKVIDYYKSQYNGENRNPQDAFKIAELYVKKKDFASAVQWYDKESQLINSSKVNLFNYAHANQLMGEYQKALDGYLMYAALTGDVNKVMDLANQCERILRAAALTFNYKLENYSFNTVRDENYVGLLRTNAIYITTPTANEKNLNDLNQVVRQYEGFGEPIKAYYNNIPKLVITSVSYTKDGNIVVFSAYDNKISSKKKEKHEKLYIANNLGGTFLNAIPLSINKEGYIMKNPSVNAEGTEIYFSSNIPGGAGGFDIWKTSLLNDTWSTPVNLGKLLNSKADDINPFISQNKSNRKLYFASDRDGGFGGFDIYSAIQLGDTWQGVEAMSAPINSAADEISFIYDDEVKTGYFCSNRTDGKGGFDLYRFTPFSLKLTAYANDTFSEKPIDYALVQLFDGGEKIMEGVTDENGGATFQINKDKKYTLKISKDGFRPAVENINSAGKRNGDSVVVFSLLKPDPKYSVAQGATNSLTMDNFIIFTGKISDASNKNGAAKIKMRMVNYTTQKVRPLDIDSAGNFEIKLLLNNNYKIILEKQEKQLTDELTTFGMEKNSIKVRDYVISGNKLNFAENKVYTPSNLPPARKISLLETENTAVPVISPPQVITQNKIDSLLKIITNDKKISETYFKIQLINSDKENIDFPEIKKLGEIETIKTDNYYIYRMGDYDTVEKAKDILKSIRENGYKMAFILQYKNGKITGVVN